MPSHVESRADLIVEPLVESFLGETHEEDARLFKLLSRLDEEGRRNLAGVLGRFDVHRTGSLNAEERLLARKILGRLRRPSTGALALLNRVLDYLDLDANGLLAEKEVRVAEEAMKALQAAESRNDTLSDRELELLYAVLRGLDRDHDGRLSRSERAGLDRIIAANR